MKVIIVGGVAGGATAAARIRRLNEHAEITVFERSGYISYMHVVWIIKNNHNIFIIFSLYKKIPHLLE